MKIPIVNEQDEIIGSEERSIVHRDGLCHREIHVFLVTTDNEIIFQKRALNKDTWPGYLDATAGGHVDVNTETYEKAAERELLEETGVSKSEMFFVKKMHSDIFDPNTNTRNNKFRSIFVARYSKQLDTLVVEDGGALGFAVYSLNALQSLSDIEKNKFIPELIEPEYIHIYEKMIKLLKTHETQS